jgi:hypothetical protein
MTTASAADAEGPTRSGSGMSWLECSRIIGRSAKVIICDVNRGVSAITPSRSCPHSLAAQDVTLSR